jgi:hypothetical protein
MTEMASADYQSTPIHIQKTKFWNTVMEDVFGPRKGGAIIFLDAENARKGVAKTSAACAVARLFARAFRYNIQKEDFTLSASEYLTRYREHPGYEQPSVLVIDEFVGAGAGDKRRSMASQNVDFGRAWQLLRTKRVVTIATLPDWNEADKRLKKYADYRIWCREKPIGSFQAYKVTVPFNASGGSTVHTKGLGYGPSTRRIQFPNMDAEDDPYYKNISEKKDELIDSETWDADDLGDTGDGDGEEDLSLEELHRRMAIRDAINVYKPWDPEDDTTYKDVTKILGWKHSDEEFAYGKSWVGDRVKEWREGEHRDLVPDPTGGDEE